MKLGIDFGTSFSLPAVSYLGSNIVLLPSGKYGIPSVFYYDEWEGVLVGEDAENAGQGTEARNLKREVKLELNSSFTADGKEFTAKQIVGYILNNVKENALSVAKSKLINETLEGVVISVPAAFGNNEKEFIRQAAEIPASQGGPQLKVLGFIKEPVAAALAYYKTPLADKTRILVYDLGGGTCDVAIVESNSRVQEKYTVIASDMRRIGGKDWDKRLEAYIMSELERQSGLSLSDNPGYTEKVKRAAISAKHSFSEKIGEHYRDRVRARVEVNGRSYQVPITKDMFDELTNDLLAETIKMTNEMLNANNGENITKIICVGGSSNMPQVINGLEKAFPSKKIQVFEPEKSIAIGASIYAEFCDRGNTYLSDIASFSYGIRCYENYRVNPEKMIVANLIKKGDRLPITKTHGFMTAKENVTSMTFNVVESMNTDEIYDYSATQEPMMQVTLDFKGQVPRNTKAKLHMTLTNDGIIELVAGDEKGNVIKVQKKLLF